MKSSFDTDAILYKLLRDSSVKAEISGDIYYEGDRPADSDKEDIIINTVTLTQDFYPQLGDSNVNVYVKDSIISIGGKQQRVVNRARLKQLTELVIGVIRDSRVKGLKANLRWQRTLQEADINQTFVNIRISWNIQE